MCVKHTKPSRTLYIGWTMCLSCQKLAYISSHVSWDLKNCVLQVYNKPMYKNLLVSSVSLYHLLHNWRYWTLLFLRLLEYRWFQVNQTQIILFRSTHIKTTRQMWPHNSKRLRATYFHSTPGARCAFPVALNRGRISLLTCPKLGYPLCSISKNGYMPYQACAST